MRIGWGSCHSRKDQQASIGPVAAWGMPVVASEEDWARHTVLPSSAAAELSPAWPDRRNGDRAAVVDTLLGAIGMGWERKVRDQSCHMEVDRACETARLLEEHQPWWPCRMIAGHTDPWSGKGVVAGSGRGTLTEIETARYQSCQLGMSGDSRRSDDVHRLDTHTDKTHTSVRVEVVDAGRQRKREFRVEKRPQPSGGRHWDRGRSLGEQVRTVHRRKCRQTMLSRRWRRGEV